MLLLLSQTNAKRQDTYTYSAGMSFHQVIVMIFSLKCLITTFFSYRDFFEKLYFEVVVDYYLDCNFEVVLQLANKLTKVYNLYIDLL